MSCLVRSMRQTTESSTNASHVRGTSAHSPPIPHIYSSRFNSRSLSRVENVQVACFDTGSTVRVGMNVCDGQIIQTKVGLKNDFVTFHRQD